MASMPDPVSGAWKTMKIVLLCVLMAGSAMPLLASAGPDRGNPPGQTPWMTGPATQAWFRRADRACPGTHAREAKPAELLDLQESFMGRLGDAEKQRLARAEPRSPSGGYVACAGEDGATCSVEAGMRALGKAGLMKDFSDFAYTRYPRK